MVDFDVCVIGAGVMGSAAVYWLSKMPGLKILLVDKYGLVNDYSGSNDVNRVFRYAYGKSEFYTQMAVESQRLWKEFESQTSESLLVKSGLLMLMGQDEESSGFNKDSYETLVKEGLSAEWLDRSELNKRFPQFNATEAVLDKNGGVLLASKCLRLLNTQAGRAGVEFLENRRVVGIESGAHVTIHTREGNDVKCQRAIVTTGPWSNELRNNNLVSITPTRQQVVYFDPGPTSDLYHPSKFPVFFADHHYGLPRVGTKGVKVSHKGIWRPTDPERDDRKVDPVVVEDCRQACRRFLPDLATKPVVSGKVCLYDMTKDSDFVLGADPEDERIVYGYGFSGHGFKFAILIGKILADLALGNLPSIDISRCSPTRRPSGLVQPVA